MRGRKPKPTLLHKRHGTAHATRHKARLEGGEPIPPTEIQEDAPDWLSDSQKGGWRYALNHAPPGLLKAIDRGVLTIWVEAEDRHRRAIEAQAKLDKDSNAPMLAKTKDGNVVQSPYLGIINRAAALMMKAASELGFSPAARPRLADATGMVLDNATPLGATAPRRDSFENFLAQRPASLN